MRDERYRSREPTQSDTTRGLKERWTTQDDEAGSAVSMDGGWICARSAQVLPVISRTCKLVGAAAETVVV